jgi:hypothetical protein
MAENWATPAMQQEPTPQLDIPIDLGSWPRDLSTLLRYWTLANPTIRYPLAE